MLDALLVNPLNESYLGGLVHSWEILKSGALQLLAKSTQTTSSGSSYLVLAGESRNTGSILIQNTSSAARGVTNVHPRASLSARDLVLIVKGRFGLNITELARVLRVGRPTVYSWLNGEIELHTSNSRRLESLARLAEAVNGPPALDAITSAGSSLLDHLSAADLNFDLLHSSLASETQHTAMNLNRVDAALRGYRLPEGARHRLDIYTGRPLTDDE